MGTTCKIFSVTLMFIVCVQKSSCQLNWDAIWPQARQTTTTTTTTTTTQVQQSTPMTDPAATTTTTASPAFRACFNACQTIQIYNPVCGSDGITYNNEFRLQCARRCGQRIQMVKGGVCSAT